MYIFTVSERHGCRKREQNFFRLATSTEIRLPNDNHFFGGPITIQFYRIEKLYCPPFRIASTQT